MEKIDLINTFLKMILITVFIFLTYEKITNCKRKKSNYIIILIIGILISVSNIIINKFLPALLATIILYISYGFILNNIIENRMNYVAYIVSCGITYTIHLISIVISGIILGLTLVQSEYANPISFLTIPIIFVVLFAVIFTRKRFKNGFNFLKHNKKTNQTNIFATFLTGLIITVFGVLQKMKTDYWVMGLYLIIGSTFILCSLIIWIKSQITKTYKNRMRDRTIEMQKAEIDEQARVMEELKEENLKLASAIHKYNKKFSALEFAMKNLETSTEFANEISVILEETKEASKNFAKEVETKINKLPLTNNVGIDNMFKYMQDEARKNNINFDLKLNTSINPLLETIISKDKFETLIGDHLKDAIIAVNKSEASYKSIFVTLGLVDGIYEFSVFDTGIEFEIDTLLKLGKEQVTTHKDEGGTGIGFMTTFETLKECKASLIIEEYNPETTKYTKAVIIRFDGKNEYRIFSYRAEKIKEQKHEHRIIIKKLK